jgi:transposase
MRRRHHQKPSPETKLLIVKAYGNGHSAIELEKIFGYSRETVHSWVRQHRNGSNLARRRNPGSGRLAKISGLNGRRLLSILKRPASTYGFETDLWNTKRIQIICKKNLKISVSRMGIWRFLSKFEQSFKKVQKRYYEADAKVQEDWKRTVLPQIKKAIKKFHAILYFEDESNIALSPVMGKSWGPIGEKIVHKATGNRGSIAAVSAISVDGRLIFNLFSGGKRFKSSDIIDFLRNMLAHHKSRHLVVVMDRASPHISKMTKAFITQNKRLHVFWLPPRSPEFNPDEQVWAHLKNHDLKSHQETTIKGLKKLARRKLARLSNDQRKILGIFKRCENASFYL